MGFKIHVLDNKQKLAMLMNDVYTRYHVCEARRSKVRNAIYFERITTESGMLEAVYDTLVKDDRLRFKQEFWNVRKNCYGR
jgi:hypothetical protein